MTDVRVIEKMIFEKTISDGRVKCCLSHFHDGSVYIDGDEVEIIFEGEEDCLEEAIEYLASKGYVALTQDNKKSS